MSCPPMVPLHEAVMILRHAVTVDWDADAASQQPGFDLQTAATHIQELAVI